MSTLDLLVIGAGFAGLGAALTAAENGARVGLFEALAYPGGCASTFQRNGARFEAGATLFAGLGPEQLFGRWIAAHGMPVEVDWIDPLVTLRAPGLDLPLLRDRAAVIERLAADSSKGPAIRAFFAEQGALADGLWDLLNDPSLLPPFSAGNLLRHVGRLPATLGALRWVGSPLRAMLNRHGLGDEPRLRLLLDALCQITVQCGADEAEAPFALGAIDYLWRGTGHVRGGIGVLAQGLVGAIRAQGGQVSLADRVLHLRREADGGWLVTTRKGEQRARRVISTLHPRAMAALLPEEARPASLERLSARLDEGWGAVMLYRVLRPAHLPEMAHHLQLIADPARPLVEGNHLFASTSGRLDGDRSPPGTVTMTASTHLSLRTLREAADPGALVAAVQERMRQTLAARAPELGEVVLEMTASPRTWARFVRRPEGAVGGVPRRAGLDHYTQLGPLSLGAGLDLAGDAVFPGQSILAAAIGGSRAVVKSLSLRQ